MNIQSLPKNQRASIIRARQSNVARVATRIYRVRPARPEGNWFSPATHRYYLEITRLSDGAQQFTWMEEGWRDTDSWAHPRFQRWEREYAFWRSERELRCVPGVTFDEYGFVVRSSISTSFGGR
jgi:coproporphyrinogen III oxidase